MSSSCEDMSLSGRLQTITKKAGELSTLCGVEIGLVVYEGADGKERTWPEQREKVRDLAMRYRYATKPKKTFNIQAIHEENEKKKKQPKQQVKKRRKLEEKVNGGFDFPTWDPSFDDIADQLSPSLLHSLSILSKRLAFIEAQKQNTNLLLDQHDNYLNPNQFSLFMFNHQDHTLSKLPLPNPNLAPEQPCFSNNTQDDFFSEQEINYLLENQPLLCT